MAFSCRLSGDAVLDLNSQTLQIWHGVFHLRAQHLREAPPLPKETLVTTLAITGKCRASKLENVKPGEKTATCPPHEFCAYEEESLLKLWLHSPGIGPSVQVLV